MSNAESLGLEWKNKLIEDLGLEKYNKLFSKSIEDVIISPFYTENNQPISLLIPDQWNILGEVKEVKFIEACNEINEFLKNDINHITLKQRPQLLKKLLKKFLKDIIYDNQSIIYLEIPFNVSTKINSILTKYKR